MLHKWIMQLFFLNDLSFMHIKVHLPFFRVSGAPILGQDLWENLKARVCACIACIFLRKICLWHFSNWSLFGKLETCLMFWLLGLHWSLKQVQNFKITFYHEFLTFLDLPLCKCTSSMMKAVALRVLHEMELQLN